MCQIIPVSQWRSGYIGKRVGVNISDFFLNSTSAVRRHPNVRFLDLRQEIVGWTSCATWEKAAQYLKTTDYKAALELQNYMY